MVIESDPFCYVMITCSQIVDLVFFLGCMAPSYPGRQVVLSLLCHLTQIGLKNTGQPPPPPGVQRTFTFGVLGLN